MKYWLNNKFQYLIEYCKSNKKSERKKSYWFVSLDEYEYFKYSVIKKKKICAF